MKKIQKRCIFIIIRIVVLQLLLCFVNNSLLLLFFEIVDFLPYYLYPFPNYIICINFNHLFNYFSQNYEDEELC